jgi:polyphenol oxidase
MMSENFNCKPENIYAFIGPSASSCCYEVDLKTSKHFDASFLTAKDNNKFMLDLKKNNHSLLLDLGIPESNIETSKFCTICNPRFFHSYRRDGNNSGRMLGVIGIKE